MEWIPSSSERLPRVSRAAAAVLGRLASEGESSRAELARRLGLSASTVSEAASELLQSSLVEESAPQGRSAGAGRPAVGLRIRLPGPLMGVEFDHDHVTVALADEYGDIVDTQRGAVAVSESAVAAIEFAVSLGRTLLDRAGVLSESVAAVAMGVPAPVDPLTGLVGSSSILPEWRNADLPGLLRGMLGDIPLSVENDANTAALAEGRYGAARGVEDFLYVKSGEGLGGSVVLNGSLYLGRRGNAGEIGHVSVAGGRLACWCGNVGCLETESSLAALLRRVEASFTEVTSVEDVRHLVESGNQAIGRLAYDMGWRLGVELARLCTVLDIDRVFVGGELAELTVDYIRGAREAAVFHVHPQLRDVVAVEPSGLRAGGLVGAVELARLVTIHAIVGSAK